MLFSVPPDAQGNISNRASAIRPIVVKAWLLVALASIIGRSKSREQRQDEDDGNGGQIMNIDNSSIGIHDSHIYDIANDINQCTTVAFEARCCAMKHRPINIIEN